MSKPSKEKSSKAFDALNNSGGRGGDEGIDPYELQAGLMKANALIPTDVVISLFNSADINADGALSLEEFTAFLSKYENASHMSPFEKRKYVLFTLVTDYTVWLTSLYTLAGIFLVLPAIGEQTFSSTVMRDLYLVSNVCYLFMGFRYLVLAIINAYNADKSLEKQKFSFKAEMVASAEAHAQKTGQTNKSEYEFLLSYIKEDIFQDGAIKTLSKSDLEILLLQKMGSSVSDTLLTTLWSSINSDADGIIEAHELNAYIVSLGKKSSVGQRLCSVLTAKFTNAGYCMSIFFSTATLIGFILNISSRLGTSPFGSVDMYQVTGYMYLVGTLFFTYDAYHIIATAYDLKMVARTILAKAITEMNDSKDQGVADAVQEVGKKDLLNEFLSDGGLDESELNRFLEQRSVFLPEIQIDAIFADIDSGDGIITMTEILDYIKEKTGSRQVAIAKLCMKDFNYWAQFAWFIGSIFYLPPLYIWDTHPNTSQACNIDGAILYLVGGVDMLVMRWEAQLLFEYYAGNLYKALTTFGKDEFKDNAV